MPRLRTWKRLSILAALALVLALGALAVPMAGTAEASPDEATFYSTASDGGLANIDATLYSDIHDASSGTVNAGSLKIRIGQSAAGSAFYIYRGGLFFDTSPLPDDAIITSATLSLYGSDDQSDTNFDITVVDGSVLEDPMVDSDYGDLLPQTTAGGTFNTAGFSTTGYNDIALSATGISWISKTGTTKFGLRSSRDISATQPSGSEHVRIWASEQGVGYKPKLVVTYTTPPGEVWVDNTGPSCPDTGNGTQADPYCKIQTGIDNVAPGGTVHVYPGKYNENLVINKSLTLQSVSGNWQDTIIDDAVKAAEITISGDVDVTVQGFEITAGSSGIYIGPVFSTVDILDCFIHDNDFDGICVASSGDVLNIERNIISQNGNLGGSGIYIQQAWTTVNILDNIIGGWWGPAQPVYAGNYQDGIRIDDVPVGSHVTIDDNLIVANGDDGIDFPSVTSVDGSVNIEDNVIGPWTYGDVGFSGNGDHGIHVAHVSSTGSINIEGNAISENSNDGINFGSGISAIYGSITILRNIIGGWTCYPGDYGCSGDPQRYGGNGGEGIYIFQVGDTGTVTIEYNKISENAWGDEDTGIDIEYIYGVVTIAENDIGAWEDSHGEAYLGNAGDGVYVYWVYPGAVLTIGPHNSIKGNTDDGIEIYNAQPAGAATLTIHHNTINNNDSNGIELGTPCEVDGATISHNSVTNHLIGIYLTGPSDQNIISDNEIRNNIDGIVVEGNDNQILRNNIVNNQGGPGSGIHIVSLYGYPVSGNVIHCNNIVGNLPYGVSYEIIYDNFHDAMYSQNGDEAVDATGNWWGCIEGPGAAGCDLVFGNVIYDPWLPDEFQYCRECGGTPRPPPGVPTVNHWGIAAMITVFAGLLVWRMRRRQTISLKRR